MKYHKHFRITHIMECLEKQSDDIESLIAIKSRNLSYAYNYLEIAKIYHEAKQHDKALDWAEKGLKAFPVRTDSRLRAFIANEYHRLKRHDDAISLIWTDFTDITGLEQYKSLKVHADRISQWEQWREKAHSYLREDIAANKQPGKARNRYGYGRNTDNSELVRIFLWEGDVESALREAKAGGCNNYLWLDLAKVLEEPHPEESIRIYKVHIEAVVAQTKKSAYEEAVRYIVKVQKLMSKPKDKSAFEQYLHSLKTTHKRKRNFMKLLDKMK